MGCELKRSFLQWNLFFTAEEKIRKLLLDKENVERVSKMVSDEVVTLRVQCDKERESAKLMKLEANRVRKLKYIIIIVVCSNDWYT